MSITTITPELEDAINHCLAFNFINNSFDYRWALSDKFYLESAPPSLGLTDSPFYAHLLNQLVKFKANHITKRAILLDNYKKYIHTL